MTGNVPALHNRMDLYGPIAILTLLGCINCSTLVSSEPVLSNFWENVGLNGQTERFYALQSTCHKA